MITPLLISTILLMLSLFISFKQTSEREKPSPYECGFEPSSKARLPFSLRFFMLTIIFLIFDIEIAILLPIGLITLSLPLSHLMFTGLMVILILTLGLLHEWVLGALSWLY